MVKRVRLGVVLCLLAAACSDEIMPVPHDGGSASDDAGPAASDGNDAGPSPEDGSDGAPLDGSSEEDASLPDPCPSGGTAAFDVLRATVEGPDGSAPKKGDTLTVSLRARNLGTGAGSVKLTVLLDSQRFQDFVDVPLGSVEQSLCPGETTVTLSGGPFLSDAAGQKRFALGRSDYTLSVLVEAPGQAATIDDALDGAQFALLPSGALLVPVIYDARYFEQLDRQVVSPEAYLEQAFTRPNQVFTPSGSDPDGAGNFEDFPGGFDQMMGVTHKFLSFAGFPGENTTTQGWCEDAGNYVRTMLGLSADWTGDGTRDDHHGFDYVLALHPDMGGGVACGWLSVQVSSFINRDLERQQIILVHETGHLFGAPHCDDVGNGEGGSLQGYVMCSGEKHRNYPGNFVWHATSRALMQNRWN